MRYNRLRDLGLNEDQIKNNLLFSGEKVGDMMTIAMRPADAKAWFGAVPPDLSVIARAKSGAAAAAPTTCTPICAASTRTIPVRPAGTTWWCRTWRCRTCCGSCRACAPSRWSKKPTRTKRQDRAPLRRLRTGDAGLDVSQQEFDTQVADLVAYMSWMAEPSASDVRKRLGAIVLLFLSIFAFLAWRLNASYWKDVK
jgi:ubiquinol-cytochrome c reductase cytochrome c1 subunit